MMLQERIEKWNQEIREEGRQEGEAALLIRQLERKFGSLDPQIRKRVEGAEPERLFEWGDRVLTAERLEDVFEH